MNDEMSFFNIPEERKRALICLCIEAILHQKNKTKEHLEMNKAKIKAFICRKDSQEKGNISRVKAEIDFVNFVYEQILNKREQLYFLNRNLQQESVYEIFEGLGIIETKQKEQNQEER